MNNNFFSDVDEAGEFRDIPDEVVEGQQAPPVSVRVQQVIQPVQQSVAPQANPAAKIEYVEAEEVSEEDEDFSTVLSDARLRLEQGRLYETIMQHDIFAGMEADEKAVKYVQKQIRNFAKEQMEIMLGMRQEASKEQQVLSVEMPFNALEVEALKALAAAATKGASRSEVAAQYIAPVVKQTGLNPIVLSNKTSKPTPIAKTAKPLPNKPSAPVKRTKNDTTIDQILAEEGVTREELEKTFDPNYKALNKPLHELTPEQIIERNRQAALRTGKQVKSTSALPMPSAEQEEFMYAQRAQAAAAHPQMQSIMNLLNNPKKK